jgi:purine nucleosidase
MSMPLVLMDHDGAIDDYLAALLLLTMDQVQPLGIVVTPADCYIQPAVSITRKMLDLVGRSDISVAESTVRGINPFPTVYRRDSLIIDHLPILNQQDDVQAPLVSEPGQNFMVQVLREAPEPVTLLVTGPLTTLAVALDMAPEIESKIERLIWMGGALNVPGNISAELEPSQDGTAEWNAYWDAIAIYQVWKTNIPIIMCPLDITNTVPLTPEFVRQLGRQRHHPLSDLAGQCYALALVQDYYLWDVLTTAYIAHPEFYKLREWETQVITGGPSQGRIVIEPGGRNVQALDWVDTKQFYDYVLQQWAR